MAILIPPALLVVADLCSFEGAKLEPALEKVHFLHLLVLSSKDFPISADIFIDLYLECDFNKRRAMVQKKRHLINRKSMVEVIYRKSSKSSRKLKEPPRSGDRSDQTWSPDDYGNIQSKKKKKIAAQGGCIKSRGKS